MKKIICIAVALLVLSLGTTAMAAPLNDLAKGQTAVGIASDNIYIEHKTADRFTIGLQNIDVSSHDNSINFYGQYHFTNNLRGIIGHRNYNGGVGYLGIGVIEKLDHKWDGHAYVVFSNKFTEAQVGATYTITNKVDANVYLRSFMPDAGSKNNHIGIGLTYKY